MSNRQPAGMSSSRKNRFIRPQRVSPSMMGGSSAVHMLASASARRTTRSMSSIVKPSSASLPEASLPARTRALIRLNSLRTVASPPLHETLPQMRAQNMKHTRRVTSWTTPASPAGPRRHVSRPTGMTRQASGEKGNLPNFSQYGDNSHPVGRMGAVRGASELALHLWAILGSNQ